ncbi:MAG: prepilin-type N-terminal cleavage/methylation domain-containing protein [Planctomycetaceae bacterium]|nr:prepilin-type N-terminal cleavage/methylation domain-containing protein [Planctomycetaceae bacterium]
MVNLRSPAPLPVRRRALTLIELVIVIAILTILGGLVVQTLPNLMKRTHLSKCADTISSLNKIWGEAYALNTRYPDQYDSLLSTAGTTFTKLTPGLTQLLTPTTLTAAEVGALSSIGVRNVVDLNPAAVNVTYDSAPLGVAKRAIDGAQVAQLTAPGTGISNYWDANPLALRRHLETTSGTVKYVAFGIGPNCNGIGAGKLIQEAPVHFGADDTINPNNVYQRYLAIYSVVTDTAGKSTAYFEAMAGNDVDGPSSAEAHVRGFHEGQAAGN